MINYEAWYEDEQIYNGTSKSELIIELHEYIEYQNHINETEISVSEINNLNEKALNSIGIKLFFARW